MRNYFLEIRDEKNKKKKKAATHLHSIITSGGHVARLPSTIKFGNGDGGTITLGDGVTIPSEIIFDFTAHVPSDIDPSDMDIVHDPEWYSPPNLKKTLN